MKNILITGSSGLIGTALCEKFAQNGWEVHGVDKYLRGKLLKSNDADTKGQIELLQEKYSNIIQYEYDIREYDDDSNKTLTYMVDIFTNYKGGFSEDMDELKWVIGGEYSDHDPEIAIDFAIQLGNELEGDV